jgi:DNA invertase Pin-like site-specific DNA recombinase
MIKPGQKTLRCAVYTRVSTEHGLEQEFNSLDAQREAAAAYVKSQTHEGWRLVKDSFDDGGVSGGSLDRPALQRLLAAIRARLIDVVVVYKVDRLTRSLADFAKLVEIFDAHGVSFVSVTQSFNTTSSMGRLTLNMLLSFAQFEREVTGERIRDKLAASKRRGIWVGGIVPLGYEVRQRKLVVREDEACTVRLIFERYLALGSLPALQRELRQRGIVTRRRTLSCGRSVGGVPLTNGPLAHILRNRVYLGELNHKGASYPGEHEPIVTPALFDAVQDKLTANRNGARARRAASGALLIGRIFDDRGNRMTPSTAKKGAMRYRYYVSSVLAQGRRSEAGSMARASASELEAVIVEALRTAYPDDTELDARALIEARVARVVVRAGSILSSRAQTRRTRSRSPGH